uniref:Uncharacterized protein n=1 Tax=Panagrolaimus davidi TaxID=227884 RepID=A0A914P0J0_9BILA
MKANANPKSALILTRLQKYFIQEKCPFYYIGDFVILDENCLEVHEPKHQRNSLDHFPNNLGFKGQLEVNSEVLLPQLISKIIICDITHLNFSAIRISYNSFIFLTASERLQELDLDEITVTSKNGEIVPYEDLLDHVPFLRHLKL